MVIIALYDTMWIDGNTFDLVRYTDSAIREIIASTIIQYLTTFLIIVQKENGNNIGGYHTDFKWRF